MLPKVSIIVAAYNIENYIEKCIKSLINQTYKNIEIIIINDGSTDNTLNVIKKINDKRIKIISTSNRGTIEARKTGLYNSSGEYVLFVDGDDWLDYKCIEKVYKVAREEDSDIVLYNIWGAWENRTVEVRTFSEFQGNNHDLLKDLLLERISPSLACKLIKKEFITSNNIKFPNNTSFGEDLAVCVSLFVNNPKVSSINESLYYYYQREGSTTKKASCKILELDKSLDFIYDILNEYEIFENYKIEFEYLVYMQLYERRFCNMRYLGEFAYDLQRQIKKRKIKIHKNKYINNYINNNPLSYRIRAYLYSHNYYLGKIYDIIRNYF